MPSPILVVGEALVDVVLRSDGSRREFPGGSPLNVAVAASRLGTPTVLAAQLGDDEHGELIRRHVEASGVRVHTVPPAHHTATATAHIQADGAADYDFDITWNPESFPDPAEFAAVHTGSIGMALGPGSDRVLELLTAAYQAGIPVTVDPNVRLAITPDVAAVRRVVHSAAAVSWAVKLSDEDAAALLPDMSADSVVDAVLDEGPSLVVLTQGSAGIVLASPDARVEVPTRKTEVVDTIGAGDTAMGALLATCAARGWLGAGALSGSQLEELGSVAVRAAAITCSRAGADPPWQAELSAPPAR
jgi:fructokinase